MGTYTPGSRTAWSTQTAMGYIIRPCPKPRQKCGHLSPALTLLPPTHTRLLRGRGLPSSMLVITEAHTCTPARKPVACTLHSCLPTQPLFHCVGSLTLSAWAERRSICLKCPGVATPAQWATHCSVSLLSVSHTHCQHHRPGTATESEHLFCPLKSQNSPRWYSNCPSVAT